MDLKRINFDGADVVHVREDVDVRIAGRVLDRAVVEVPPLRIVVRHRADECELHRGDALLDLAVGVDHAERVFPGVEAGNLGQERPADVDPELVDDVLRVLRRKRHVLRGKRVDRRRPDVHLGQPRDLRHVLVQVEDRGVVTADRRQQHVEDIPVRRRKVDVAAPHPFRVRAGEVIDHRDRLRVVHDHDVVLVDR